MKANFPGHRLNINRRNFIGKLGIGVGSAAISALLLPKLLKGSEGSNEAALAAHSVDAKDYHVSITGLDSNPGTQSKPFKTISRAAEVAQPGDTITVHKGIYRERVNPPRGGISDDKRIVYQAADGEKVAIKGSEAVKGWQHEQNDTWQVSIPNSFFGDFNPYNDLISGDWFRSNDRQHHTGAVYLNGHWLTEAASQEDVLKPAGKICFGSPGLTLKTPRFGHSLRGWTRIKKMLRSTRVKRYFIRRKRGSTT